MAYCKNCGAQLKEDAHFCTQCGAKAEAAQENGVMVIAQPESPQPQKKSMSALISVLVVVIVAAAGVLAFGLTRHSVKLNEYNQIILTQKKNNDALVQGKFALTLKDVKVTQKFIKKNFPGFNFEEEGYITDDYRNELLIKEFNESPSVLSIYLKGIENMAGKSQVYSHLRIYDDELFGYYFSIDQEFSDRSGFEYFSGYYPVTRKLTTGRIEGIRLRKYLYTDTNEPYWIINWDDEIPAKERLTLLNNFLASLRYAKVFKNFAFDFLQDVFTGIDEYQTMDDIVDWWD